MERTSALHVADEATDTGPVSEAPDNVACEAAPFLLSPAGRLLSSPATPTATSSASNAPLHVRALDVSIATLLIILFLPLMVICSIAVLASSGAPLLFRHRRIGRGGVEFDCLKFRTMVHDAETSIEQALSISPQKREHWEALHKMKGDPRVTPLGAFLRRYFLDELPQLFNILAGDMSLVGPRPIVAAEVERYGPNFTVYCSVKPGLTGLWQVSGRHRLSYPERVELDVHYVKSRTLLLDLVILWRTGPIILWGQDE